MKKKGWRTVRGGWSAHERAARRVRARIARRRRAIETPDPDYMLELADDFDVDVSDLYDMFYGYAPGSRA